jgi:hypothetical protein
MFRNVRPLGIAFAVKVLSGMPAGGHPAGIDPAFLGMA